MIVPDLSEHYGIDLYDPALSGRPWPWLKSHILGLLSIPSRLSQALAPAKP